MIEHHPSIRTGIPGRLLAAMVALVLVLPMLVLTPASASAQEDPVRLLVLSKNPGHGAASVAAANAVRDLAADISSDNEDVDVEVDETSSTAQFSDASFLEQYDAIVFNFTSGQVFDNQAQRDGFQAYIQDGGGFVGLHFTGWAAGGNTLLDTWPWYHDLVGAKAINHPENPAVFNADVVVSDTEHALVEGLPERHRRADEWYDWVVNPANDVKVLVEVDTATYASGQSRNGTLHPLTWCQEYDGGRSWYTSMGHGPEMWSESYIRTMLRGGLEYSSGIVDADCSPRAKDQVGEWSDVIPWSLMPINAALTAEGKVQTFGSVIPQTCTNPTPDDWSGNPCIHQGGQFEIDIWEPSQERTEEVRFDGVVPNTTYTDLFCAIQVNDPNRRTMLTMGGDDGLGGNAPNEAAIGVTSWSERAGLQNEAPMKYPRWYPTSTVMPNGDIVVQGGSLFGGPGGPGATTPELYTPDEGNGWKSLEGATSSTAYSSNQNRWWYPRAFVSPEGDLYNITGTIHYSLDPYGNDGEGELTVHGQLPTSVASQDGLGNPVGATSTATMYAPGKIMQVGGGHWQNGGGPAGARAGFTVDLTTDGGSADPVFETIEPMRHPRHWADSTVLPDGKVIVTGGSRVNTALGGIATTPEIWDPETGQWESDLAVAQRHRLYHSTALLLPDGRVMTGGGGAPGPHNYANVEFYSPPYLFDGDELAERPEITDAPSELGYDGAFDVSVSEEVDRVTLVRSGSVTHSFNNDQRFLELDFVATGDGQITVNAPDDANDAPPGTYLLFVFNEDGTPSVADLVQLDPEVENDHRTPVLVDQFEYPRIPTTWASGTYPANVEVEPGNARMAPWVVDSTVRLVRGLQSGLGGMGKTGTHLDLGSDGEVHRTLTGLRAGADYRIALRYGRDGRVSVPSDGVVSAEISVADLQDTIVAGPDVSTASNQITSGTYVATFTASSRTETLRFAASGTSAGVLIDDLVIFAEEPGLDDAPVHYAFDEGEGTSAANTGTDLSVGSATLVGDAGWTEPGVFGSALELPGGDGDHVELPDGLLGGASDFTVSLWAQVGELKNWMPLFQIGNGTDTYFLLQSQTQPAGNQGFAATFKAEVDGSVQEERLTLGAGNDLTPGAWTHVVFTMEGSTGTLYFDGEEAASREFPFGIAEVGNGQVTTDNYLGNNNWPDPTFNGLIDDVRAYYSSLTADDVAVLHADGSALRTTTTITTDPESPAPFGEPVTVTATVEDEAGGDAEGTAMLLVNGSIEGNAVTLEDGQAVFPPLELSPGEHTFEVRFTAAEGYRDSMATIDYEVERPPPGEGVPIHYPFDEGEGRSSANVGSDPTFGDATLEGNTSWTQDGMFGPAVDLPGGSSGAGNFVDLPDNLTVGMNDEFTVSLWTRPRSQPTWVPLIQLGSSTDTFFLLQSNLGTSPGGFGATFKAPGNPTQERLQLGRNLPNNQWTHVVFTMRGSTGKIYWNGELEGQRNDFSISIDDVGINGTTTANYLGNTSWPDPTWNGVIDDLRIYNHELSEDDVRELFEGDAETSISATAEDMVFGTDGAVEVTVTPEEAPGTVEVADGDTLIGSAELEDGEATVTIPGDALEVGTHTLDVRYLGADGFLPSDTQVQVRVTEDTALETTTSITVEPASPTRVGEPLTVSAQVEDSEGGAAEGRAELWVDGTRQGDPVTLEDGAVTFDELELRRGEHTIQVRFLGDDGWRNSQASVDHTVLPEFGVPIHYTFDEGEGTSAANTGTDSSFGDATLQGNTSWIEDGVFDGAVSLPGGSHTSQNWVDLPDNLTEGMDDEFSVSIWTRPRDLPNWVPLLQIGSNTDTFFLLQSNLRSGPGGSGQGFGATFKQADNPSQQRLTVGADNDLPLDEWTHVVFTMSGSTGRIYFNGELMAERDDYSIGIGDIGINGTTTANYLGNTSWPDDVWNGDIDDVRIYRHQLDEDEIARLFEGVEETLISATAQDMVFGTDGAVEATVTPSAATGTVEVADGDTVIGSAELEDGEATVTIPGDALGAGTHTLDVRYLGDEGFEPSATQVELTVTLPPIEAELAIDPVGAVNNQTGEATVSGTVECSRAADYSFEVEIEQRTGRFQAFGSATVDGTCSGDETVTWSATLVSDSSLLFGPGHVSVQVEGSVDDGATTPVPIAATEERVRLRPAR